MAAFKKGFLVLVLVLLALAGASGTAYAQFHPGVNASLSCNAFAVPAQSRAEGLAELLGDIVVQCSLQNPTAGGFPPTIIANVSVTLNVEVTNNRDFTVSGGGTSETTDAVLVVNEVTAGGPFNTSTLSTTPNIPSPQYGTRVPPGTLQWSGVILPVPGIVGSPGPVTSIRITNMRGNVSRLGIPTGEGAFPSAQVQGFIAISSQTAIPVTNNVLNIGIPLLGLSVRVRGQDQADVTLPIVALQCRTQALDSDSDIQDVSLGTSTSPIANLGDMQSHHDSRGEISGVSKGRGFGHFSVRLSEGYASSFKTLGVATVTPASAQVERGFPTPSSNCIADGSAGSGCGGATQGTRFILRFYNVPNGVRLATPNAITGTAGGGHVLRIVKVAGTDALGAGALNASVSTSLEVSITGGFGFVVYEVTQSNPFTIEQIYVPVTVAFRANTGSDLPAVGTLQVSAAFAPLSTTTTSSASAPEPRFVDTGSNRAVYSIARCNTNLLFPFVTNQSGFDTGIAISNTSADDKGTAAQAGSCTLYYFGGTAGGGAQPPNQTTSAVAAGKQLVFTVSAGNPASGVTGTPGFQGYMMALCQFQFAHGFAFITDGFGGVPTIAEGYLALVVPWNGVAGERSAGTGEGLGH